MDKSSKDHYIQAYLERQKFYVHSYTSEGLEHEPPTSVQHQDAKNPSFGFDTPVLLPRVTKPTVSPSNADKLRPSPAMATQRARKERDAGISGKENNGPERASLNAIQRDSSKRKKAIILSCSDDEHEARLSERRARKRVKRAIVKPDTNIAVHISPASSEKENKKVSRKKGKKHSSLDGLALLHGLSATNVGKNRLTLKPLASVGVFNKGKSSTKVRVRNANKSGVTLFSELAFLGETTKQPDSLADESVVQGTSSQPPSPSAKKSKMTNYRKDKASTCSTNRNSLAPDLLRGTPAMSETWDIELQSKCPSTDGFSSQPDQHITGSLILDSRMASWHDNELPSKGQAMHSALVTTPVKETLHDSPTEGIVSPAPASAIATVYDLDRDSSVHPSHSASQIGLKRLDHPKTPGELLTSQYFAVHANHDVQRASLKLDQPQQVECQSVVQHYADNSSGVMSNCNPCDAYTPPVSFPHYTNTIHRAAVLHAMDDSSPLRVHGISQEQFLPLADDLVSDYRISSVVQSCYSTKQDVLTQYHPNKCPTGPSEGDVNSNCYIPEDHGLVFVEPWDRDFVNSPSFYSPVQAYPGDGPHYISEVDMVVPDEVSEGASQLFEYTQDTDHCERSDIILERPSSYQGSFASVSHSCTTAKAYDDTSCSLRPFLQGRAMLLGIPPYVPKQDTEQMKLGNGLLSAEVDVAKRLKDHWRPHKL